MLWRGDRGDQRPALSHGLDPLLDAFGELPVEIVPLPFGDARVEEVRADLAGLDGLLVGSTQSRTAPIARTSMTLFVTQRHVACSSLPIPQSS